jgi:hypothetical protein
MNNDLERIRKEAAVALFNYYLGICLEGLKKTTKNLSHDSQSQGRDLNPGPPEYETGNFVSLHKNNANFMGFRIKNSSHK